MTSRRGISLLLVWGSFYQQLAWAPILVVFATAAGDPGALALAASAYSLANMFGNLSFGVLADRRGRLRVAGWGFLAMALTSALHLAATTPALLVGIRLLHGLAAAAVAPAAFAALAEGIPPERRAETMARAGIVIALASMLAPPLTGILESRYGIELPVWTLAAGLLAIGAAGLWAARGEVPIAPRTAPGKVQEAASAAETAGTSAGNPARNAPEAGAAGTGLVPKLIGASALAGFAVMFAQNVLFYAFPLKGDELGLKTSLIGSLFSAFAVGAIVAFLPPLSKIADRRGRRTPLIAGLGVASLGLLGLGIFTSVPYIAGGMLLYGLGFGIVFPAVSALNADGSSPEKRGAAFGILAAAFSAGAIVGPLVAQGLARAVSPFVTSAIVILIVATLLLALLSGKDAQQSLARSR